MTADAIVVELEEALLEFSPSIFPFSLFSWFFYVFLGLTQVVVPCSLKSLPTQPSPGKHISLLKLIFIFSQSLLNGKLSVPELKKLIDFYLRTFFPFYLASVCTKLKLESKSSRRPFVICLA